MKGILGSGPSSSLPVPLGWYTVSASNRILAMDSRLLASGFSSFRVAERITKLCASRYENTARTSVLHQNWSLLCTFRNDQFWCRTLVRAVFSYLEAHSFVIRSATLKLLKPDASNLESIARILLLADTVYQPSGTGKLEEGPEPRIPFINQFAFTLRMYAEAGGMKAADITKFFGDNAFNQLRRAKNVRDRLTHPKSLGDITVTPADVLDVTNAFNWVSQLVLDIEAR